MALVEIAPPAFDVDIHMIYATAENFTGAPVYGRAGCYLHGDAALRNRLILLGLMASAGWDHYLNEWWHYQLFEPRRYPLLGDSASGINMMTPESIVQAAATRDTETHG